MAAMLAVTVAGGCVVTRKLTVKPSHTPIILQNASKQELVEKYNALAGSIQSLNATVTMQFTSASDYSGVIEQYHEINGFILAQKPADIRVIGQVPIVGKNLFDMVSNGETFRIFVPSKNEFLEGSANVERPSPKAIENLRPQHLLDAIFWTPLSPDVPVLFNEADEGREGSFYVLMVAQRDAGGTRSEGFGQWRLERKIWFNRRDLSLSRIQIYDNDKGLVSSDIEYGNWGMFNGTNYPNTIILSRPISGYQFTVGVLKLMVNEPISAERFELNQPEGSTLVEVGQEQTQERP